jgi:hypothetical protein
MPTPSNVIFIMVGKNKPLTRFGYGWKKKKLLTLANHQSLNVLLRGLGLVTNVKTRCDS